MEIHSTQCMELHSIKLNLTIQGIPLKFMLLQGKPYRGNSFDIYMEFDSIELVNANTGDSIEFNVISGNFIKNSILLQGIPLSSILFHAEDSIGIFEFH